MTHYLFLALLSAFSLHAQEARARLTGIISDQAGAVIAGATITAIQTEMNTRLKTTSNESGHYNLDYLLPGPYRIEVEAPGFSRLSRQGIEIRVGDVTALDLQLSLGNVSESITVTEDVPLLDSATSSVSTTIDRRLLDDLPLNGNNAMYALGLTGGAVMTSAPGHNWLPSAVDTNSGFTFAGARGGQNEFSMDGISNMTRGNNSFSPPGDMIQEVRIDIAGYDASQGRAAGANVNMAMRSGTNKLRLTAIWDHMPDRFGAVDFFTNARLGAVYQRPITGAEKRALVPKRTTHRYSATLGGPLSIPRLYNGRNRTFWTYGFQGFNRRAGGNNLFTIPSERERNGDFSEFLNLPRDRYTVYDPLTIQPAPNNRFSRQPFPNNIIPTSRLDPIARRLFSYWPLPNSPRNERGFNNYQTSPKDENDFRQNMLRVDHNASDRNRFFARLTQSWLSYRYGDTFDNQARGTQRRRFQWGGALDNVFILSPSFILNTRAGFTRFFESDHPKSLGFDLSTLGFSSQLLSQIQDRNYLTLPEIAITNYTGLSGGNNDYFATNNYNFASTATRLAGGHTIKFGLDFRIYMDNRSGFGDNAPSFTFAQAWTRGPLDNSAVSPLGQSFANFVLGLPTAGGIDTNTTAALSSRYFAAFLQDDWRLSKRITINAGLRWEFDSGPTERFNRAVRGFNASIPSPISAAAQARYAANPIPEIPTSSFLTPGVMTFANLDGQPRRYFDTSLFNLAPRIGIAFKLTNRLLIRTGYGIFFNPIGVDRAGVIQNGFSLRTLLNPSLDSGQTFQANLANPFPNGIQQPSAVGPSTWLGRAVNFWRGHRPNPYIQRWSFSLQRQLPGSTVLESTYVGSRATHLGATRQLNALPAPYWSTTTPYRDPSTISYLTAQIANPFSSIPQFAGTNLGNRLIGRQQLLRPFPQFTNVNYSDPVAFSWYHSLQTRIQRRYSRGLILLATYTWSKNMEADTFLNEFDPMPEHVISDLDRPHRLAASGIWELPFGRGRRFSLRSHRWLHSAFGGWQFQAIYQRQVGSPVSFPDLPYFGDFQSIMLPASQQSHARWFNTSDFVLTAAQQLDWNVRRFPSRLAGLRNPGDNWWDMSLMKSFQLSEKTRLQLRTNWEGALNTPQFGAVSTAINNFGQIATTRGEPRRVFFGLRLMF